MKKLMIFVAIFIASATCFAKGTPHLNNYVNDFAHVMKNKTNILLEAQLKALDESDSTQVVIVTIPTLDGKVLEQVSFDIATKNGIGQNNKNNGVLFLMALKERSIRIEVGLGLEGVLTDALSGEIIDNHVSPHFANGNFDKGFKVGVEKITKVVRGEYDKGSIKVEKINAYISYTIAIGVIILGFVLFFKSKSQLKYIRTGSLIETGILSLFVPWTDVNSVLFTLLIMTLIYLASIFFGWISKRSYFDMPLFRFLARVGLNTAGVRGGGGFRGGGGGFGGGGASGRF